MFNKQKLLENITQPDDRLLISKVLDQVSLCMKSHEMKYTDFLDPYQLNLCEKVISKLTDVSYEIFGGYIEAERKLIIIYPNYISKEDITLPFCLLKIYSRNKFSSSLGHRDYLGALLNLGVRRENMGDIVIHEEFAFVFVLKKVADYVQSQLNRIRKDPIEILQCSLNEFTSPKQSIKEINTTVSSLRLDSIASAAYGISRTKILPFIRGDKLRVNWEIVADPSFIVKEGDTISFRGHGRVKLNQVYGTTKKGRIQINICKYI